jgi:hypothetical protein
MTDPATDPQMPEYKGAPLDAERGPGLGCFWTQMVLLVALLILTPLSVVWAWPSMVSAALLILSLVLLFFTGQTMIFLLRLVAADRRSRRRPMAPSARPTVGDLEAKIRHSNTVGEIGDKVVIADTAETRVAGYASRTGVTTSWTTPSESGVEAIGLSTESAIGVTFEDGSVAWFDPDLVIPTKRLYQLHEDDTGAG